MASFLGEVYLLSMSHWAAAVGAALFVLSDTMIGLDRFRPGVKLSPVLVLGTYYAAQWLIAFSTRTSRAAD